MPMPVRRRGNTSPGKLKRTEESDAKDLQRRINEMFKRANNKVKSQAIPVSASDDTFVTSREVRERSRQRSQSQPRTLPRPPETAARPFPTAYANWDEDRRDRNASRAHTIVQQDPPRTRPNNGQRNWAAPGGTAAKRYGGESGLSKEQIRRIANTVFEARNRMPRFKSPGAIYVRTMKNAMKEMRAENINTVKQSF